ncbi:MAG: hypothetical protein M1832_000550 [Thelocarpon impressellum]|nr:MAG: hypothetical protein M1832_000550 [Thelocarpon impressellum]
MASISTPLPPLTADVVSLYHTTDPRLSNSPVLVFHGPSTTTNSSRNSARIQAHVFTAVGFQTYPRITVSPSAPLYAAVTHLPREQQGDEVCRGLAIGLLKYFVDMPDVVKATLAAAASTASRPGKDGGPASPSPPTFDEVHAAELASTMTKVTNADEITRQLQYAYAARLVPSVDIDVSLPPGSVQAAGPAAAKVDGDGIPFEDDEDPTLRRYGRYSPLVALFGAPTFLPTSKMRRAPSKPTTLNRSKSLLREQKEAIRRELAEFVATEERYIGKVYELVNGVAKDLRAKASGTRAADGSSPSKDELSALFPPSLDEILHANSQFSESITALLSGTEQGALQDMQLDAPANPRTHRDATGALAFSRVLLEWFPKFAACYADYMRASSDFPAVLASLTKDPASGFARSVRKTGEQRLRSLLIEPVQRLPRYTLFIDNIVNLLPSGHRALQPLLRARDIVTDICALESAAADDQTRAATRLRSLVGGWPQTFRPQGRIIAAADCAELTPPFCADAASATGSTGILLLFAECLVLVRKSGDAALTARGVVAEVDRPSPAAVAASLTASTHGSPSAKGLVFSEVIPLSAVRFSESAAGQVLWMTVPCDLADRSPGKSLTARDGCSADVRAFHLSGPYEGKAGRWIEEAAKARIEARFPEAERESDKWELRSATNPDTSLTTFAAICECGDDATAARRKAPALVQLFVDPPEGCAATVTSRGGVEVVVTIISLGPTLSEPLYSLETQIVDGTSEWQNVSLAEIGQIFGRTLRDALFAQNMPQNPALISSTLALNQKILRSLAIHLEGDKEAARPRAFRPTSPVKLLSSFLGGGSTREPGSPGKHQRTPILGDGPAMPPLGRKGSKHKLQKKGGNQAHASTPAPASTLDMAVASTDSLTFKSASQGSLEDTMETYLHTLQGTCGRVNGRLLRGRAANDELAVNELYNTLLEDPSNRGVAAESEVGVLFAAFEKFLRSAWRDGVGTVVTVEALDSVLAKSDTAFAADFEHHFKSVLEDMAPQNRRAFGGILRLLAALLDGSGSDGDRGALTATFAEFLVPEGDALAYMSLLDRLVDDYERLFDERPPLGLSAQATPLSGSVNSTLRTQSIKTGSMSSNNSSMRKRLGFNTPSRENSKHEAESKVGSMWRNLSKSTRGENATASMSKASLMRSKSTDVDARLVSTQRPTSHDRPTVLGSFPFERESSSRPGSSHLDKPSERAAASSPGDNLAGIAARRKRRSSLSDLRVLQNSPTTPSMSSLPRPTADFKASLDSSPKTPSPVKGLNASPAAKHSPNRRGNTLSMPRGTLLERPHNVQSDEVTVGERGPAKKLGGAGSGIPTFRGGLRERQKFDMTAMPRKEAASPPKLRIQSPQKLRERLQNEQRAINSVDQGLQAELAKLGDELSLASGRSPQPPATHDLATRLDSLEARVPTLVADLKTRHAALATDVNASLAASETKARQLDELCRQANAENAALYDRFNDELAKMMGSAEVGRGEEALLARLEGTAAELKAARAENARLKRENVGLRGLLKG